MKIWPWKRTWIAKNAPERVASLTFENVKKIAVLKHAALGDLYMTRPFLVTLRHYFPNAHITLSVASHYMKGVPDDLVDSLHITHGSHKRQSLLNQFKNYRQLGEQDIIFDISAVTRTFWITLLNKSRLKVGFKHKAVHPLIYDLAVTRTGYKLEAETFLDQLLALGLRYQWPLDFALTAPQYDHKRPYIVYFPTASDSYKAWEADRFKQLIDEMLTSYPEHDHILLSGIANWEQKVCENIARQVPENNHFKMITGGKETIALVSNADLLVCNDTGIRNMAIAYSTPTVGLFIETLPFNYEPRFGKHEIIYNITGGQPEVSQVKAAADKILA